MPFATVICECEAAKGRSNGGGMYFLFNLCKFLLLLVIQCTVYWFISWGIFYKHIPLTPPSPSSLVFPYRGRCSKNFQQTYMELPLCARFLVILRGISWSQADDVGLCYWNGKKKQCKTWAHLSVIVRKNIPAFLVPKTRTTSRARTRFTSPIEREGVQ